MASDKGTAPVEEAAPPAESSAQATEPATAAPEAASGTGAADSDSAAALAPSHVLMANRLSLVSWGDGSVPSMPAVDDSSSDGQSSTAEENAELVKSTTTSVRTSLYNFVEENGRTYHRYKEGKYPLPNDAQEQSRLDLQHAIFILSAHGKSFLAPIDNPKRVLDFATGTGIWAIEFALQFPDSDVLGTDLSPIQPDFLPANCRFEVEDAEDEWSFEEPFDYVHARAVVSCFRDTSIVIRSAFNFTKPGGYFELQDGHFPLLYATPPPENCALKRWMDLILQGTTFTGRPWTNVPKYARWMREAGFEDVVERKFYWPCNTWARGAYYKRIGAYVQENLSNALEGLSLKLLSMLGMQYAEIQALIAEVRRDLLDTKIHSYIMVSFVWGRRPEATPALEAAQAAA